MPSVASIEALNHAIAAFDLDGLELAIEPPALAAARRSLDESGLLLLGEVHGVRENPLLIRALMRAFGLSALALEWPSELAAVIDAFMASGVLAEHPLLWFGDGRITAGHLAVLRERAGSGPLDLTLFDGTVSADASWSARDEMMAGLVLARATAAAGTLAVAGNAHTPTRPTSLGVPLGAWLARGRPGVLDIRIRYGGGRFYNLETRRFASGIGIGQRQVRLHLHRGRLVLDLPEAREAIVPHRPWIGHDTAPGRGG